MERYDIRVNVWGGVTGPQYEWETVKAEDGDFVLYADAQAQIEALQARVQELEARQHFGACAKCLTNAWRICKEDAPNAVEMKCSDGSTWWKCDYCAMTARLAETYRMAQDSENERLDLRAEVEALQRERDEAIREHGKESGFWGRTCARLLDKRDKLQTALDAEREKVKELEQQVQDQSTSNLEIMRHTDDMQSRALDAERALAHLQALVQALVCTRTYMVDGEYIRTRGGSVLYACSSSISAERLGALLDYRATLDATTPTKGGDGE